MTMEILATFDGSTCSEAIIPQLRWMAALPDAHVTLLSIARPPHETQGFSRPPRPAASLPGLNSMPVAIADSELALVEDRGKAIERTMTERCEYLEDIVSRMPDGPPYAVEVLIETDVGAAIIRYALQHKPDVIVMATHGESRMIHRLFGDTAEQVMRSGIAPVLLVPA